jgi:hypothetical protein
MPDFATINAGLDRAATVYETALMLSTIAVFPPRDGSTETFDPVSGDWTDASLTAVYEGIAHIRQGQARPIKTVELGEALNTVREWRLRVPRGTDTFEVGSTVTITANSRTPEMVGQWFRIDDWPEPTLSPTPLYMMTQYHPRDHRVPQS